MALFFDADWFDSRLAAAGLSRADLGRVLGLSESQMTDMWKDQREISAHEVMLMSALLGASTEQIAKHAGISTPVPRPESNDTLHRIEARLARIEDSIADIKSGIEAIKKLKP